MNIMYKFEKFKVVCVNCNSEDVEVTTTWHEEIELICRDCKEKEKK